MSRRIQDLDGEHGVFSDLQMSSLACARVPSPQVPVHRSSREDGAGGPTDRPPRPAPSRGTVHAGPRGRIPSDSRTGPAVGGGVRSSLLASLLVLLSVVADATSAQGSPPDPAEGIPAFLEVRRWLDKGTFPELGSEDASVEIADASAVGVLLRLDGRAVGRGLSTEGDDMDVRRAAGRAFAQALGDRVIRDLPPALRDRAGRRLTLEIEIAGPMRPLVASTLAAAATRIRPGIDGVSLRRDGRRHLALPGRQLATGTASSTASTLLRLVDAAGLPAKDLPELRRLDAIELEMFETVRLGQDDADGPVTVRRRSGPVLERATIDRDLLEDLRARLEARIDRWRPPSRPEQPEADSSSRPWFGPFDPVSDRHEPLDAAPPDAALATWALARANPDAVSAIDLEPGEPLDPELVDLGLLAASARGTPEAVRRWWREIEAHPAGSDPIDLARRAAALCGATPEIVPDEIATAAHAAAWAKCTTPSDIVAAFDWLALAERGLADRRADEPTNRLVSLRAVRDALLTRQIDRPGLDTDGAIPLRAGMIESVDARSLRPALALAVLRSFPEEDEDAARRSEAAMEGLLRFLRQLMMSERESTQFAGGRRGVDGIALGLADPGQQLAATATALVVVDLLLEPLDRDD